MKVFTKGEVDAPLTVVMGRKRRRFALDNVARFVLQFLYEAVNGIPLNTRGQGVVRCHE